ncbi:MAG: hypothetical protein ACI4AH_07020 [Muribaculaceae bacterium]
MENNIDYTNTKQLLEMAQRYFDASLSKSEEHELMRAAACNNDPRLDELKAVMAFAAYGKAHAKQHRRRNNMAWRYGVAACFAAMIVSLSVMLAGRNSEAVAYIGGKKVTDNEQVMQQMLSAMRTVDLNHTDNAIDDELKMMFNTIN